MSGVTPEQRIRDCIEALASRPSNLPKLALRDEALAALDALLAERDDYDWLNEPEAQSLARDYRALVGKRDKLATFIESVRDLGRGAFNAAVVRDGTSLSVEIEDALDIFDRQIDHILGFLLRGAALSEDNSAEDA